jgi:molybdopterin molybdotransferase
MTNLSSVEDALRLVLDRVPPPLEGAEPSEIEYAIGCVLFEDVRADADSPAWPRSRVDGYAIASAGAPGGFDVVCTIPAGRAPGDTLTAGQAARIFTGAPVPGGADAVVKQEDVSVDGRRLTVPARVEPKENVTARGAECRDGAVVASRGTVITPGVVGALAAVGRAKVRVTQRPSVTILSTGSELVPVDVAPPPGHIRNSNAPALMAAMWSFGGWPKIAGIAKDVRPELDDALKTALADDPSILLVTGGVSVGDFDHVPAVLADAGAERVFHGVNVQPGKPLWFGVRTNGARRTLIFGLPGNPVSALVNAALFVRPAIRAMSGRADVVPETIRATLGGSLPGGGPRRRFVPARLTDAHDGRFVATPVPFAGSGDVFGYSRADALVVIPEDAAPRAAGDTADVVSLAGNGR